MRSRNDYILQKREVESEAEWWLAKSLRLKAKASKCDIPLLLKLLLLAASRVMSLGAACQFLARAPSDQTVYNVLHASLPEQRELQRRLNLALVAKVPQALRSKPRHIAIDLTLIPYYGRPSVEDSEIYRGPAKAGTTKFHAYATAFVVQGGFRWTLALLWVRNKQPMRDVLQKLLHIVRRRGVRIKSVLLDRGFYSVDVMTYLRLARYPHVIPVALRGRKPKKGTPPTGVRALRKARPGYYAESIQGRVGAVKKRSLNIAVCVAWKLFTHPRKRTRHRKVLLYAVWGVRGTPREIMDTYRLRFGIETSYRQMNQARIKTCTRGPEERLLFIGLALVLRNVWAWLHFRFAKGKWSSKPTLFLALLRFKQMLCWIAQVIDELLGAHEILGLDFKTYERLTAKE